MQKMEGGGTLKKPNSCSAIVFQFSRLLDKVSQNGSAIRSVIGSIPIRRALNFTSLATWKKNDLNEGRNGIKKNKNKFKHFSQRRKEKKKKNETKD